MRQSPRPWSSLRLARSILSGFTVNYLANAGSGPTEFIDCFGDHVLPAPEQE